MISLIIPTYNKYELLNKCIESILNQTCLDFEIIVVDNGSKDKDVKFTHEKIRYINLECNYGFSKAVNIGIKQARYEFIGIINNDTILDKFWIESVLEAFSEHPEYIYITCKILNYKKKGYIDTVGDVILQNGQVYKLGNDEKDIGQYEVCKEVFSASGCASVFRRRFFEEVGYYDEDFFAYIEDIDLSFRANLFGYKCLYVPKAIVYHLGSATTGSQFNKITVFYFSKNTINMIIKNYPNDVLIKSILFILKYLISLQLFFILKGYGMDYFKGIMAALKQYKIMVKKREEIQRNRKISTHDLLEQFRKDKEAYKQTKKNRALF